jgi:hypothetical protein
VLIGCGSNDGDGNVVVGNTDGDVWTNMDSGTFQQLSAIWGTSSNNVYVAGNGGTIINFDGDSWNPIDIGTTTPDFRDIWGTAPDNVYATGHGGTYQYDGNQWSKVNSITTLDPGHTIVSIWASSPTNIYAVATLDNKVFYSNNGNDWEVVLNDNSINANYK